MAYVTNNTHANCRPTPSRRASFIDLMGLYRQRRALAALDDDALRDLGISRDEALTEARRPLWDIPS